MKSKPGIASLCALALAWAVCLPAAAQGFKHENNPENLRTLFSNIHQAVHAKRDAKQAAELMQSVMPDEARVKKALKDNVGADALQRILSIHKSMPPVSEREVAKLARPEQGNVKVHGSKTEDLIAYREGSVAHKEFPGGAKKAAEQVLRPGMTFYEVEFLELGKDAGMKYHLFYWDGKQWSMLGPVWRVLDAK
jgi:hypothetical protein